MSPCQEIKDVLHTISFSHNVLIYYGLLQKSVSDYTTIISQYLTLYHAIPTFNDPEYLTLYDPEKEAF